MTLIEIDERFYATHTGMCWELWEHYIGKDKDGNPKPQTRICGYFGRFDHLARYLLTAADPQIRGGLTSYLEWLEVTAFDIQRIARDGPVGAVEGGAIA